MLQKACALLAASAAVVAMTFAALVSTPVLAQPSSSGPFNPPANGPRRADPTLIAIRGCTLHTSPDAPPIEHATIVVKDGRIAAVMPGENNAPARLPVGPRVIDAKGMHVYAAFIDPFVEIDAPKPDPKSQGLHWNEAITPQRSALDGTGIDAGTADSLRKLGFAAAGLSPRGGVIRGRGAAVSLAKPSDDASVARPPVYAREIYQVASFDLAGRGYPDSQMGAIALLRQTFLDADWQFNRRARSLTDEPVNALDWLAPPVSGPASLQAGDSNRADRVQPPFRPGTLLFDVADELESLRATKIAVEFQRPLIIVGSGTEFTRLEAIKTNNVRMILPLNFARTPDVASVAKQDSVELRDLMLWEQSPTNPRRLAASGVPFALTSSKVRDRAQFTANLRKAVKHGLSEQDALAALTTTPAAFLGLSTSLGTIEVGKVANLIIADGPLFADKTKLRSIIVDGIVHELGTAPEDYEGTWDVTLDGSGPATDRTLIFGKDPSDLTVTRADKTTKASRVIRSGSALAFTFDHDPLNDKPEAGAPEQPADTGRAGIFTMNAAILREGGPDSRPVSLSGTGLRADGERFAWSAKRRPRPLSGLWPVFFDAEKEPAFILIFREAAKPEAAKPDAAKPDAAAPDATTPAPQPPRPELEAILPDGTSAPANFTWDGSALTLDIPAMGGRAAAKLSGTIDWTGKAPIMSGSAWRATRTTLDGSYRVFETDGAAKDPKAKEGLTIEIGGTSAAPPKPTVKLTFTKADDAKDAEGKPAKPIVIECEDVAIDPASPGTTITFKMDMKPLGSEAQPLEGKAEDRITIFGDTLTGTSKLPDGTTHTYKAKREEKEDEEAKRLREELEAIKEIPEKLPTPFGPFGTLTMPPQDTILFTNATVWTLGPQGTLQNASVLVQGGRITYVGIDIPSTPAGTITIDAQGKHLTPGIIDCHSHTGISKGVNEGGQAITAEVRIQDVTDPNDVNWYRQLAGGVTVVNNLHGSANAIGGQSQTNKLRWGSPHPDDMHMEGAKPGIKFALGENPTGVNWRGGRGEGERRYPGTRMGVEQLIRDRFTAAREYAAQRKAAANSRDPVRRDLELDAIAEILAGDRWVHAHSYRQDEILMLAQVAGDFKFKIGTYQHILEGYKVADAIKAHAVGASGFTDWWAFKVEVQDAIPGGFPLMEEVGVVVSYNSDSNELARRMNTEAAKAVKYSGGRITPADALKFVTLNPAIQLGIDSRVGSVEAGKEADLALWSADPLSTYSKCEMTLVDGRILFSLERDQELRQQVKKERQRLIQKVLADGKRKPAEAAGEGAARPAGGRRGRPPTDINSGSSSEGEEGLESDDFGSDISDEAREQMKQIYLETLRSGRDPRYLPGVCGCGFTHW
jgi:imidazolonepropionase-like amidohydrolase